jgi:hypothetical protein
VIRPLQRALLRWTIRCDERYLQRLARDPIGAQLDTSAIRFNLDALRVRLILLESTR